MKLKVSVGGILCLLIVGCSNEDSASIGPTVQAPAPPMYANGEAPPAPPLPAIAVDKEAPPQIVK